MRGWFVIAACSGALVWACSSESVDPPESGTDAGPDVVTGQDAGAHDSAVDAPISCDPQPSTDPTDPFCFIAGPCPACAKASPDRVRYLCSTRLDGGDLGQPLARKMSGDGGTEPLPGCNRLSFDKSQARAEYCCPAGCVEQTAQDNDDAGAPYCPPPRTRSFVCPANADGESTVSVPPGCTVMPAVKGTGSAALCCE